MTTERRLACPHLFVPVPVVLSWALPAVLDYRRVSAESSGLLNTIALPSVRLPFCAAQ